MWVKIKIYVLIYNSLKISPEHKNVYKYMKYNYINILSLYYTKNGVFKLHCKTIKYILPI
jgi:hypothetical protein